MTDKELLELAAKAAGITLGFDARGPYEVIYGVSGNCKSWNPLKDDGDALRLAVKLCICIKLYKHCDMVICYPATDYGADEPIGDNLYTATRRAIVRTAAEIGGDME